MSKVNQGKYIYYKDIIIEDVDNHEDKENNSGGFSVSNVIFRYFKHFIVFFFCYYTIQECQNGSIKNDLLAKLIINLLSLIILITCGFIAIKYSSSEYFKVDIFLSLLGITEKSVIYNYIDIPPNDDNKQELEEYREALSRKCYKELKDEINSYVNFTLSSMTNYFKFWFVWRSKKWNNLITDILSSKNKEQEVRCLVRNDSNGKWSSAIYKDGKITQDDIYNQGTVDVNTIGKNTDNIIWPVGRTNLNELSSIKNFIGDGTSVDNDVYRKAIYATKIQTRFNGHKSLRCKNFPAYKEIFKKGSSVQTKYNQKVENKDESCIESENQAITGFFENQVDTGQASTGNFGNIGNQASTGIFGNIANSIFGNMGSIGNSIFSLFGNDETRITYKPEKIKEMLDSQSKYIPSFIKPYRNILNAILVTNPDPIEIRNAIKKKLTMVQTMGLKFANKTLYNQLMSNDEKDVITALKSALSYITLPPMFKDIVTPESVEAIITGNKSGINEVLNKLPEEYKKNYRQYIENNSNTNIGNDDKSFSGNIGKAWDFVTRKPSDRGRGGGNEFEE